MPISSGSNLLHPNAQATLQLGTPQKKSFVEIIGQGVFINGSMLSGGTPEAAADVTRPHGWVHTDLAVTHVQDYTALSGGEFGNRQLSMRITDGTVNVSKLTSTPSTSVSRTNALSTYHSGQEMEWEVSYKIPSGTTAGHFFRLTMEHSAGSVDEVLRASGSTVATDNPTGWVLNRGRFGPITDNGPTDVVTPSAALVQSGADDSNFEVILSHLQVYPVHRVPDEDVLDYSFRKDTEFSAAAGDVTLRNDDGRYSFENAQGPLQYGNEIRIFEAVDLSPPEGSYTTQWLERYRGAIAEVQMTNREGINRIKATALDMLSKLDGLEISGRWIGEEVQVEEDLLHPASLGSSDLVSGELRASVWSAGNFPWTQKILPTLRLESHTGILSLESPEFNTFFPTGQVLFAHPIEIDRFQVPARYRYVAEPLHAEDLLEQMFTSGDGFGFAPFNLSYHLRSTWSEQRSGVDVLTPNTVADSLGMRIRAESAGLPSGDYAKLLVDGVDVSLNQALSYNIAAINSGGVVIWSRAYDVTSNSDIATMSGDIQAIPSGSWVAVASRGTPVSFHVSGENMRMFSVIGSRHYGRVASGAMWQTLGIYDSGSWAFVGRKGLQSGTVLGHPPIPEVLGRTVHVPSVAVAKMFTPYDPGLIWNTRFNRWITPLNSGDLTMPAGGEVLRQNARLGVFVISGVDTGSSVFVNRDYEFSTIQATGIELSEYQATLQDTNTRLDAFRTLRDSVIPPNYILHAEGRNVWGEFFNQNTVKDYDLRLATSYTAVGDDDLFTRVRVFGESNNPTNLSFSSGTTVSDSLVSVTGSVTDLRMTRVRDEPPDWRVFGSVVSGTGRIVMPPFPIIKVDGVDITSIDTIPLINQNVKTTTTDRDGLFTVNLVLAHKHIDPTQSITFRDIVGSEIIVLPPNSEEIGMLYDDGVWRARLAGFDRAHFIAGSLNLMTDSATYAQLRDLGESTLFHQTAIPIARRDGGVFPAGHVFDTIDNAPDLNDVLILELPAAYLDGLLRSPTRQNPTPAITAFEGLSVALGPSDVAIAPLEGLPVRFPWVSFFIDRMQHFETVSRPPSGSRRIVEIARYYIWPKSAVTLPAQALDEDAVIDRVNGAITTDGYLFVVPVQLGVGSGNEVYEWTIINGSYYGIAAADYTVMIPPDSIRIVPNAGEIWLNENLFGTTADVSPSAQQDDRTFDPPTRTVTASYSFQTITAPVNSLEAENMLNGSPDDETQITFHFQPVPGTVIFTLDLGRSMFIEAIDIVPGFYRPPLDLTGQFKFDVKFQATLLQSLTGVDFEVISPETTGMDLSTGSELSIDSSALGADFQTRFIRMELDGVSPVIWQGLQWPVSIAIFSIFSSLSLRGEAKLVDVVTDSDVEVLDTFGLRQRYGDKLHKEVDVKKDLNTQAVTDKRAKDLLTEFEKNHTRLRTSVLYHPGMVPGVTVHVKDPVTGIDRNYFVEQIADTKGALTLRLAYFP